MIRKLLVAYDASPQSEKAFDFAVGIAAKYGATLIVCSVATLPEPPVSVEVSAVLDHAEEFYTKHFTKLAARAAAEGITPRFELKVGHPAEQIILLAEEENVQMIAMGHRGNTLVEKWMLGSVCRRVINYANCTVSVVR
ncbi:MAG TPA: universal stress protein [Desulfovibrio sp.]|uniref:universal stress protein n=1 Tax=Desulfovibrio sp. TaxID=885 RepID=UPI002CF56243|nr:universal stress protein [Desulfovibrio sp.]HMM39282.1 universal stress protein [Desulfovibrio sp.]